MVMKWAGTGRYESTARTYCVYVAAAKPQTRAGPGHLTRSGRLGAVDDFEQRRRKDS